MIIRRMMTIIDDCRVVQFTARFLYGHNINGNEFNVKNKGRQFESHKFVYFQQNIMVGDFDVKDGHSTISWFGTMLIPNIYQASQQITKHLLSTFILM